MNASDWRSLKWLCVFWGMGLAGYPILERRYVWAVFFVALSSIQVAIAWRMQQRAERGER